MPILKKDADGAAMLAAVEALEGALKAAGVRVKLDATADKTPGWKFNQYEMKGVPVRVEVRWAAGGLGGRRGSWG